MIGRASSPSLSLEPLQPRVGFSALGFPCLIHLPSLQIQVSSGDINLNINMAPITISIENTKEYFLKFFMILFFINFFKFKIRINEQKYYRCDSRNKH
jgi:hypothetical protein